MYQNNAGGCNLTLAFATVPSQRFERLYPLEKALCRGTLFEALDLPFEAVREVRHV
ncbi:MAG: spore coat associated protein CotJA [Clostridia bacterium]|nr:spore coat associated protein CotJA [Clostridia bacterium]